MLAHESRQPAARLTCDVRQKTMSTPPESGPESEERVICPSCHALNAPLAGYCVSCHAPLNSTIMLDPMGQIEAEGFALREATVGRPKLIVVVGFWLLLFPLIVMCSYVVATTSPWIFGSKSLMLEVRITLLTLLLGPVFAAVFGAVVLYKATINYWRRSRQKVSGPNQSPEPPLSVAH